MKQINMNLHVSEYSSRVLGVIKEKYSLKDKSEALDKFADMYGEEFVNKDAKEEVVLEIIRKSEAHIKKHGYRSMPLDELRRLCGSE
ncbi:DUF2683 family protein [Candidatus Woesearchaeota archaeon]|nr:DUF2683 family protein [Candidatus Woesearchaeota archaeon]